jgi:hypothetical protein
MGQGRLKRLLFGRPGGIAGTVYGTIIVMATVAVGAETDVARLAVLVAVNVVVLWIAHVYAHALAESVESRRRLNRRELGQVVRHHWAIPAAAVVPVAALLLAKVGIVDEQTAVWLALGAGVATLAVQGARYATIEELGLAGTLLSISLNVSLGLAIVLLEALVAH